MCLESKNRGTRNCVIKNRGVKIELLGDIPMIMELDGKDVI